MTSREAVKRFVDIGTKFIRVARTPRRKSSTTRKRNRK